MLKLIVKTMKKAVTLVEVVVALLVLSIIAALAIPKQSSYIQDGYESAFDAIERNMFNNVELIAKAYKEGKGKKLSFNVTDASINATYPVYYGFGSGFRTTDDNVDGVNLDETRHYIPQVELVTEKGSDGYHYFRRITFEFDAFKGNETYLRHHYALGFIDDRVCELLYHALSGEEAVGMDGETRTFSPHKLDTQGSSDSYDGECKWTYPKEIGKSQRVYKYDFRANELKRVS